ncbi:OmpA family protein [Pyruvatibacter sp. HU-CL02332]|uniref:OmpA family protein n=1 Tax=Pyruvatibacter sp. HU-CL02332 TaxID=3127650 RepID=UPI00296A8E6C|nr:OmpA family protein [Alphaproteobacteria bacterium]
MNTLSRLIAVGAFFGLAGCGLGGTFHVESFLDQEISGDDFYSCLAAEYQDRATSEVYVDCEWRHSVLFAEKGRAALAGGPVAPFDPANVPWGRKVLDSELPELQEARGRLIAALDNGGRDDRGCACAKAQRYYDGWVEQASDNEFGVDGAFFGGRGGPVQPERVASEKVAFYEALTECESAAADQDFVIYFGFDKFNLTSAAMAVIDEVANFTKEFNNPTVNVVGHTDTSGSVAYNQGLSQRRSNAVANALAAQGVTVGSVGAEGESSPAVPTGDGVREPLNRRAVIEVR